MNSIQWTEVASGVWRTRIGTPDAFNPLQVVQPQSTAVKREDSLKNTFPFSDDDIGIDVQRRHIIAHFPLTPDECIYGLGLQFKGMNHRGRTKYLRVNSDPKIDNGETHAPVPFYVSNRGYGVLVNTSRIVTVHCGSTCHMNAKQPPETIDRNDERDRWMATPISDRVEVVIPDQAAEIYVFAGNDMLDVVSKYNLFCGGGALPPRWGLGFWHRVPTLYSAEEVQEEANEFRQRGFPCDVIGLEPGWHSKSYPCTYEWHPERFHDPESFVTTMKAAGFHINLWENPYVSPDARIYPALKPLSGSHSVWAGLAPDYSLSEVQATYTAQHKQDHLAIGVSGYKLDECDGSELTRNSWMFPAHAQFPSGYDGEQMRQMYGLLLQKITTDMYRESGQRTYGLVRASTAGASSFPYVLYTDLYDHREFVRALCNSSFSGLLWTPEVRNAKNEVDWVRRIQTVCFSPIAMLDAWSSGTKPWSYPHVEHIVKKYMNLRMQLLPYFYSAFARYHYEGIPPFRALHLDFPEIASAFRASYDQDVSVHAYGKKSVVELDDQFMAGDSLLVAPLFEGQSSRRVYLPRGFWYDFETGERYEGGQFITVQPGLEKIPLFVKDGGIIPMMPVMQHVPKQGQSVPLEIRHYGTKQGVFKLYDDDGVSLAYESGDYQWMSLEVRAEQDGLVGAVKKPTHTNHASYGELSWKINYRA